MNPNATAGDDNPDVDVLVEAPQWLDAVPDVELICRAAAIAAIEHAAGSEAPKPLGVCILLADDVRLRDLNRSFRGIDRATNVLAFPSVAFDVLAAAGAEGPPAELGDVAVAYETTVEEARVDGKRLADHLSHLVVHGVLHLLGHDHGLDADAAMMEALETRILARLGVPDPYASES
jgi:probable rRNA maturation factor